MTHATPPSSLLLSLSHRHRLLKITSVRPFSVHLRPCTPTHSPDNSDGLATSGMFLTTMGHVPAAATAAAPEAEQHQAPPFTVTPPAEAFKPLQPSTPSPLAPPDVNQYLGTTVQQPPCVPGFEAYQSHVPLSYPSQNAGVPGAIQGHFMVRVAVGESPRWSVASTSLPHLRSPTRCRICTAWLGYA
jgi:hypothetical protein